MPAVHAREMNRNAAFTNDALPSMLSEPSGKLLFRGQVNRGNKTKNYGRQIPQSESKEVRPKKFQSEQRRRKEKSGHRQQAGRRQEKVPPLSLRKSFRRDGPPEFHGAEAS